jgi:hypothetical protein
VSTSTESRPKAARKARLANGADRDAAAEPAAHPAAPPPPEQRHVAEVAHAVHGRIRLRIPAARRDPGLLGQLKAAIGGIDGVDTVEVKPGSGCLVVYYDSEHHPEVGTFLRFLHEREAAPVALAPHPQFAPARPPQTPIDELTVKIENEAEFLADHSTLAKSVVAAAKRLDKDIKRSTNNNLDLKIMVPLALAGVTFLEIGAAAATPMWITLAIFSLNHFVELHAHDADKQQPGNELNQPGS